MTKNRIPRPPREDLPCEGALINGTFRHRHRTGGRPVESFTTSMLMSPDVWFKEQATDMKGPNVHIGANGNFDIDLTHATTGAWETIRLSFAEVVVDPAEPVLSDEKTLDNLFFVSRNSTELPTHLCWVKPEAHSKINPEPDISPADAFDKYIEDIELKNQKDILRSRTTKTWFHRDDPSEWQDLYEEFSGDLLGIMEPMDEPMTLMEYFEEHLDPHQILQLLPTVYVGTVMDDLQKSNVILYHAKRAELEETFSMPIEDDLATKMVMLRYGFPVAPLTDADIAHRRAAGMKDGVNVVSTVCVEGPETSNPLEFLDRYYERKSGQGGNRPERLDPRISLKASRPMDSLQYLAGRRASAACVPQVLGRGPALSDLGGPGTKSTEPTSKAAADEQTTYAPRLRGGHLRRSHADTVLADGASTNSDDIYGISEDENQNATANTLTANALKTPNEQSRKRRGAPEKSIAPRNHKRARIIDPDAESLRIASEKRRASLKTLIEAEKVRGLAGRKAPDEARVAAFLKLEPISIVGDKVTLPRYGQPLEEKICVGSSMPTIWLQPATADTNVASMKELRKAQNIILKRTIPCMICKEEVKVQYDFEEEVRAHFRMHAVETQRKEQMISAPISTLEDVESISAEDRARLQALNKANDLRSGIAPSGLVLPTTEQTSVPGGSPRKMALGKEATSVVGPLLQSKICKGKELTTGRSNSILESVENDAESATTKQPSPKKTVTFAPNSDKVTHGRRTVHPTVANKLASPRRTARKVKTSSRVDDPPLMAADKPSTSQADAPRKEARLTARFKESSMVEAVRAGAYEEDEDWCFRCPVCFEKIDKAYLKSHRVGGAKGCDVKGVSEWEEGWIYGPRS